MNSMLSVGDRIEVIAHEIDSLGQGVAKYQDLIVFIPGLLNDEKALVEITSFKKRFATAKVSKMITESKSRRTVSTRLGSLDLYHLNDDAQIDWQKEVTEKLLSRQLKEDIHVNSVISTAETLSYRYKAVYHVLDSAYLTLGLYTQYPIELIAVQTFILSHPVISNLVSKISQKMILIDSKVMKHLVFRTNGKELLVTIVASKDDFLGLDILLDVLKKQPEVKGVTLNLKKNPKMILSDASNILVGQNELIYKLNKDLTILVSDQSFLQVNLGVMEKTYQKIAEFIKGKRIIDAYSGVGSIGFYISKSSKKVVMIENNKANIEMAQKNAEINNISNVEIIHGHTEVILPHLTAEVLIVDPPRAGLHESLLSVINSKNFSQMVYLSCDLSTLARDLKKLVEVYDIDQVIPVRMFPQTSSIETLVLLNHK